jgi:hypothetical protein
MPWPPVAIPRYTIQAQRVFRVCLLTAIVDWIAIRWSALTLPTVVAAQSQIAGQVKDESGGVLPGVTVEAASPVLIEKTKSVVTTIRAASIIDLRRAHIPSTFTLTGFSTVVRDVELPANFGFGRADMKVGALEAITVSGRAARRRFTGRPHPGHHADIIDSLPTTRNIMSIGNMVPGIRLGTPDIGAPRHGADQPPRARPGQHPHRAAG